MVEADDAFLKRLLATFKTEAQEHLQAMSSALLKLERPEAGEQELIEILFREAHSLKGAARSVDLETIEIVCQGLEDGLAILQRGEIDVSAELLDGFHQIVDGLGELVASVESAPSGLARNRASELVRQFKQRVEQRRNVPPPKLTSPNPNQAPGFDPPSQPPPPASTQTLRIATAKLDSLFSRAEELLSVKLASADLASEVIDLSTMVAMWKKERNKAFGNVRSLRRALEQADRLNDMQTGQGKPLLQISKLLSVLERDENFVKSLERKLAHLVSLVDQEQRTLGTLVDALMDDMKQVMMLPFATLLDIFPKLVRDLSRDMGKLVELVIEGAELEADRRVLEQLKDPLIHLIRNCIDHGIEDAATRAQANKPSHGKIGIVVSPKNGSKVEITISDDGSGIDSANVLAAAVKRGIVSAEQAADWDMEKALSLILASGFSTRSMITDISGRGLGLAIVREKVEELGGAITVETQPGAGAKFRLTLPLTLATFRGLLIRVEGRLFMFPLTYVERVFRVSNEVVKTVENRATIALDNRLLPLIRLADILALPKTGGATGGSYTQAVVLAMAATRIAFSVDEVVNEQEVLVKSLGPQLSRVRYFAGAAVLGSGMLAPVLNVPDLMKAAGKYSTAGSADVASVDNKPRKSILVAEDSVTSRILLQHILESAGYEVTTAVDGVDALTALNDRTFDLLVSDVEMPRLNGFELTAKIRADQQLSTLPVVLVTALGSREHRERGLEVGADAYVVKSDFEQSDLNEIIRRLL